MRECFKKRFKIIKAFRIYNERSISPLFRQMDKGDIFIPL